MTIAKPSVRPSVPHFSSGPCAKRPGWTPQALADAFVGRSHRSKPGKAKLKRAIDLTREVLRVPADYRIGIVPASDTGAVEMALWTLLGPRPVTMLTWESFGEGWVSDVAKELKLKDVTHLKSGYGELPDLAKVDWSTDVVFTWNGTTSGVRVPNGDWISDTREGLTICDATSAVFMMDLPWRKLDVVTFSWQKALGSEPAHGTIIMSPRAIERLATHKPKWPIPKLYRLTHKGAVNLDFFETEVINTPSLMCIEDALDALRWVERIGGRPEIEARVQRSFKHIESWVARTPWIDFLARDPATRSPTSVCLVYTDPAYLALSAAQRLDFSRRVFGLLEAERVAFDAHAYKDAPPGLRFWCGATVEHENIAAVLPWVEWAFATVKADMLVPA